MPSPSRSLMFGLWIASGGLRFSVTFAWSAFTLAAAGQRTYPLVQAIAGFAAASALASLARGRGFRLVERLVLHGAGLFCLCAIQLHTFRSVPARADSTSGALAAQLIWTGVFWLVASRHGARPQTYREVCSGFDRGLIGFFVLLFAKLLLRGQSGVELDDAVADGLVVPFFVFSIAALVLARNGAVTRKRFVPGRRALGLVTAFGMSLVLCAVGAGLFLPHLGVASNAGYDAFRKVGGPVADFVADVILRFLVSWVWFRVPLRAGVWSRNAAKNSQVTSSVSMPRETEDSPLVLWIVAGLVLGVLVWVVWRLFLARDGRSLRARDLWHWLVRLWKSWVQPSALSRQHEAIRLYKELRRWGQRSGLPSRPSETPLEFGRRLQAQLADAAQDIHVLVAVVNVHVYGSGFDRDASLRDARSAMVRLHSPKHWPQRIKVWFSEPPGP